jgi:crossover junction endodeoxyribonuclease RuvC
MSDAPLRVLGVDPGTRIVGHGWVEADSGRFRAGGFGEIRMPEAMAFHERLLRIHDALLDLIDRVRPDAVCVEETYVTTNAKTTLRLGHARGVTLLAAARRGVVIAEYAPREIKQAVVGAGGAAKTQVHWMVCQLLNLDPSAVGEDAADALAAALCHALKSGVPGALRRAPGRGPARPRSAPRDSDR